ncbi:MAG: ABC transporter permease [Candidatus Aminicenantes bacterium]|nr:MAG: ABC transporter permease [Candidatus Aminicenantes bacterium]
MREKKSRAPRVARWIFHFLRHYDQEYSLTGDCSEEFRQIALQKGKLNALLWIWGQVVCAIFIGLKRSFSFGGIMFINYLKITIRNIKRHKVLSFINIAGLGIGLAISLFILLWVQDELSYDRFHKNHENLYRVVGHWVISDGSINHVASTSYPLGPALRDNYLEVMESLHFYVAEGTLVKHEDKRFYENKFCFADANFFSMFSFPLFKGSPETVLEDPNALVISQSMANKYFGNKDPIGKILTINAQHAFIINGIMQDIPHNSHIQADFICNFEFLVAQDWSIRWVDHMYYTYLKLRPDIDLDSFHAKIKTYINDNNQDPTTIHISLQPIKDIHLRSHFSNDIGGHSQGKALYVYIFSVVAVIVLLIACINFMNLATAQAAKRAKEIGVRKVSGASKGHLIKQFFSESLFMSMMALCFALICVTILLPEFTRLTGKAFNKGYYFNGSMLLYFAMLTIFSGLLSGSYPALFLASFHPSNILKGKLRASPKSRFFRRILVVTQFSLSIILLMGTFVIHDQITFMQDKNLGIKKDNVIYLKMRGNLRGNHDAFRAEITRYPEIKSVTTSSGLPTNVTWGTTGVDWEGKSPEFRIHWKIMSVDFDYINAFGLDLLEGRDFSREITSDSHSAYIINETGAGVLGYDNVIGKKFSLWDTEGTIVGIVKDFHLSSLHEKIEPLILKVNPSWNSYIFITISSNNIKDVMAKIEGVHQSVNPDYPFQFQFLDAEYESIYLSEERTGKLFQYFSIVAIFISCLGLFGLSSFVADQRTKEIGIRKVFGANTPKILLPLLKDFTQWVLIAILIAWPVGYYVMSKWLARFAYRTDFSLRTFLFSGMITFMIAVVTVSYKSLKAATANPIDSIRHE